MACNESYEEWIDKISRCETVSEPSPDSKVDLKVGEYSGFRGLDYNTLYLYRVLSPMENIKNKIVCKDRNSDRNIEQHIHSGSKNPSKFISTTSDSKVAADWAFYKMETPEERQSSREEPLRIVKIDIQALVGTQTEKNCLNLCDKEVREHFIKDHLNRSWAISSKEVLFQYEIPKFVRRDDKLSSSSSSKMSSSISSSNNSDIGDIYDQYDWNYDDDNDDKERVYYLAKDISKPTPPANKTKRKKVSPEKKN